MLASWNLWQYSPVNPVFGGRKSGIYWIRKKVETKNCGTRKSENWQTTHQCNIIQYMQCSACSEIHRELTSHMGKPWKTNSTLSTSSIILSIFPDSHHWALSCFEGERIVGWTWMNLELAWTWGVTCKFWCHNDSSSFMIHISHKKKTCFSILIRKHWSTNWLPPFSLPRNESQKVPVQSRHLKPPRFFTTGKSPTIEVNGKFLHQTKKRNMKRSEKCFGMNLMFKTYKWRAIRLVLIWTLAWFGCKSVSNFYSQCCFFYSAFPHPRFPQPSPFRKWPCPTP